jgi:hypothetical protein
MVGTIPTLSRRGSALFLVAVGLAAVGIGCRPDDAPVEPGPVLDVARERASYVEWLESSPISPLRAVARVPLTDTIRLGPPHADIPLEDVTEHRLIPGRGAATLESETGRRMVAPYVPVEVGSYRFSVQGERQRPIVMVFGPAKDQSKAPAFYPIDTTLVFEVELHRRKRRAIRLLALDGIEVEGTVVGSVTVPLGEGGTSLEVRHVPDPGTEESALEIYFRDETNSSGSYPSGRFVALEPVAGDHYRLDFNRARSPFCAYSTVYPCPVPWRGNMIGARVEAGERYVEIGE